MGRSLRALCQDLPQIVARMAGEAQARQVVVSVWSVGWSVCEVVATLLVAASSLVVGLQSSQVPCRALPRSTLNTTLTFVFAG